MSHKIETSGLNFTYHCGTNNETLLLSKDLIFYKNDYTLEITEQRIVNIIELYSQGNDKIDLTPIILLQSMENKIKTATMSKRYDILFVVFLKFKVY